MPLAEEEITSEPRKIYPPYIDPVAERDLGLLFDRARAGGVDVLFVLTPMHPKILRCAAGYICEGLARVEKAAHRIAMERGIPLIGSYDPARAGVTASDFMSSIHVNPGDLAKLDYQFRP